MGDDRVLGVRGRSVERPPAGSVADGRRPRAGDGNAHPDHQPGRLPRVRCGAAAARGPPVRGAADLGNGSAGRARARRRRSRRLRDVGNHAGPVPRARPERHRPDAGNRRGGVRARADGSGACGARVAGPAVAVAPAAALRARLGHARRSTLRPLGELPGTALLLHDGACAVDAGVRRPRAGVVVAGVAWKARGCGVWPAGRADAVQSCGPRPVDAVRTRRASLSRAHRRAPAGASGRHAAGGLAVRFLLSEAVVRRAGGAHVQPDVRQRRGVRDRIVPRLGRRLGLRRGRGSARPAPHALEVRRLDLQSERAARPGAPRRRSDCSRGSRRRT